jgi:hypothetical protein
MCSQRLAPQEPDLQPRHQGYPASEDVGVVEGCDERADPSRIEVRSPASYIVTAQAAIKHAADSLEGHMSASHSGDIDRRTVILAAARLIGAAALFTPAPVDAAGGLAPADDFIAATRTFLATLEPEQRKAASFAWNGPEWRDWNYFGGGGFIKPGLRLEQMNGAQKAAAWNLLTTVFSPAGLEKTRNVMTLQDVLAASGNGVGLRSSERFSFCVFGAPAKTGTWAFRLEGHHLTQSITVRDGRIVSITPSSFSALPNRITSGRHAGLTTLEHEETLARTLMRDLHPKLQARARRSDSKLDNILSFAGRERSNMAKTGVAAAELAAAQRDLLWQLVETYSVEHVKPRLAAAQKARVRSGDTQGVHFAWYGPNTAEKSFGYRVIGDHFVIEMGSVDDAAQHLHTIYHDLDNVLGRPASSATR